MSKTNRLYIYGGLLIAVIVVAAVLGYWFYSSSQTPPSTADIFVGQLSATEVKLGNPTVISATVTNGKSVEASKNVTCVVNGTLVDSQLVTLGAGQSTTVTFSTKMSKPGQFNVTVIEKSGTITVKGYLFGLLPRALDYIWWNAFATGGKWWLEANGHRAVVLDANYDVLSYNTIMQTWARNPDMDAVITSTIGAEECMPGIRALQAAGKVVILANNEAGYAPEATLSCEAGNYAPCYQAGQWIVQKLIQKYGSPKGNVVVDVSDLRSPNLMERNKAYQDVMKDYPEIKVFTIQTDERTDLAATKLGALLRSQTIDAVTSSGQGVNIGYLNALEREGQLFPMNDSRHVIFSGFDGEPTTVKPAVINGYIDWVIDQPVFAYMAVASYYGVKYLESGKDPNVLPKEGDVINTDLPLYIPVPKNLLKPEYVNHTIIVPANDWGPAVVANGSIATYGHPWIQTKMSFLNATTVTRPDLWFNVADYLTSWGY